MFAFELTSNAVRQGRPTSPRCLMGRPPLERYVAGLPQAGVFKPADARKRELEQVGLAVGEIEALRLVDLEGLSHEQAAARLGVSRQTVGRELEAARRKVADALVNGKALVIGGGTYQISKRRCCDACGWRWELGSPDGPADCRETCPECGSAAIRTCAGPGSGREARHGRCRRGCGCWQAPSEVGGTPDAASSRRTAAQQPAVSEDLRQNEPRGER
jgi:predicted DNA-binding protein (UPF0251 family)